MSKRYSEIMSKEEFEHYKFVADKGQNPLRVDRFLLTFIEFATRNKIQHSIKAGNVRVNDNIVKSNYKVKAGDIVTIVLDYPKQENELLPQDIPLNIIYEDNHFLIVNDDGFKNTSDEFNGLYSLQF